MQELKKDLIDRRLITIKNYDKLYNYIESVI